MFSFQALSRPACCDKNSTEIWNQNGYTISYFRLNEYCERADQPRINRPVSQYFRNCAQ
jgi:hypothetical protein